MGMFQLPTTGGSTGLPPGGTVGQLLAKKSNVDGDADWQDKAGIPGTFGGEFSTKADLLAYTPTIGFNYVVTADEAYGGLRTYYTYAVGGVWQYMGAFSDGMDAGGGGSGFSKQWTSPSSATTGQKKVLSRSYDAAISDQSPQVWMFESGTTNQISVLCEFDNGSASSFAYDAAFVEFVGTGSGSGSQMRLKTTYTFSFVKDAIWTQEGQYSECDIGAGQFKAIESVVIS